MHIALLRNDGFSTWRFSRGLISHLVARGFHVEVFCPPGEYTGRIEGLGATCVPLTLDRFLDPVGDARAFASLCDALRRSHPDIVHTVTMKLNLYGIPAARLAGVKRVVALVSGLGHLYSNEAPWRLKLLRPAVHRAHALALGQADRVWFLNQSDRNRFVSQHDVYPERAILIRGEGVDLEEFGPASVSESNLAALRKELRVDKRDRVVLMVARTIWQKGVREFVDASRLVRQRHPEAIFMLAGSESHGPDTVPRQYLAGNESSAFRWLGWRNDVAELLGLCDVAVLPSYHPEGLPRFLLEAASMGKPIVTTDNVGCRDVVDPGMNGFVVPPRDRARLAEAVGKLLDDDDMRAAFGRQSRLKAETEFDERIVVKRVVEELYGVKQGSADRGQGSADGGGPSPGRLA